MTSLLTGSEPGVFCGGDLAGVAETAVEAVNDGKLAAWTIHRYLQGLHGVQVQYITNCYPAWDYMESRNITNCYPAWDYMADFYRGIKLRGVSDWVL